LRAGLDHRLHHLGLDLLAETRPRRREQRRAMAFQLPLAVDDLEFLLDADGEARDVGLPHLASTMYVGTTLPAPAVTFSRALELTRARVPETLPQKRYGSWSIDRSRKCMRSRITGKGYRGTSTRSCATYELSSAARNDCSH